MLTVALVNQKGGVGKTTVTLGLASALRERGRRVLVVDLDPQANATTALGLSGEGFDSNDVLVANASGALAQAVLPTGWGPGVDAVGATLALAEREFDHTLGVEFRLRKAAEGLAGYDVVLVDCPPSVGRLVTNALVAATHALIVTEPSAPALQGVENMLETIKVIQEHYNPQLTVAGIVVNRMPAVGREANLRLGELTEVLGTTVWEPAVPLRNVVAEALGARSPIHHFRGPAARPVTEAFEALAARVEALESTRTRRRTRKSS